MARALTQTIQNMLSNSDIKSRFTLTVGGNNLSSYLNSHTISSDVKYGSISATFTLNNDQGIFGEGGTNEINVGDIVDFREYYSGDPTEFRKFYGIVNQRSITKTASQRTITLVCLDYISVLQFWDIDLDVEGTKIAVENETLTPNYLPAPNNMFSQVFNFANDSIAENPRPILQIRDKMHLTEDPQYDGFEIYYSTGQVKLGSPLNTLDNYDLIAKSYFFYTKGVYAEDVLEQIFTQPDGYGNYLFGEASAQAVIDNHLTTSYYSEEGTLEDTLTPNLTDTTITIETTLTTSNTAGQNYITVDDSSGFPSIGQAKINGDIFTYTNVTSGHTLTGIPSSGEYALKAHDANSYVKYENTYLPGQVWYLKYNNLIDAPTSIDFTLPSGVTISYIDKRLGRIILSSPVPTSSVITCNYNYTFKTLQATGIELNRITFRPRELSNRYEAISKVRKYLAPNYIVFTSGDTKIWSNYLSQKTTEDYTLQAVQGIDYMEDEDLYTRTIFYRKNKNPTNLIFAEGVGFETTGEDYKGTASQATLTYEKTEDGWQWFKTGLTNAGYIVLDNFAPIVYINGIAVDNKLHYIDRTPVTYQVTTRTETTTQSDKKGNTSTEVHTYYYYRIYLNRVSIEPSQPIYLYSANGTLAMTISANDSYMDYARGIYYAPGSSQNSVIENIATSSFYIMYSTSNIQIDYDNVRFKISSAFLPDASLAQVKASFEYWTSFTPAQGIGSIIDGRWDSQVQTEFFAEPPAGYNYAILDLGAIYDVQAIDLTAGFYKPGYDPAVPLSKFDVDMRLTLQYSLDGSNYYDISDTTHNFQLTGGATISFEEDDLGMEFSCRYLKIIIESLGQLDYKDGVFVVALTELGCYDDIVLKSEAKLIATTTITQNVDSDSMTSAAFPTEIHVTSTGGFTEPDSATDIHTAYILNSDGTGDSFTYTGLTTTSFTGVEGLSSGHIIGDYVVQQLEDDTNIYDKDNLLPKLGDRIYKSTEVSDTTLFLQSEVDYLAKSYLREFYKNHSKVKINVMYSPFLKVGQTVLLVDAYNNINSRYFIESIGDNNGDYELVLAKYPS